MSPPGVEPVFRSRKISVVTASPPSRTNILSEYFKLRRKLSFEILKLTKILKLFYFLKLKKLVACLFLHLLYIFQILWNIFTTFIFIKKSIMSKIVYFSLLQLDLNNHRLANILLFENKLLMFINYFFIYFLPEFKVNVLLLRLYLINDHF